MKRRNYIRPAGRSLRRTRLRDILELVAGVAIIVFCGIVFGVIAVEWIAGCGESYVDANGVRHQHECVFLTLHNEE